MESNYVILSPDHLRVLQDILAQEFPGSEPLVPIAGSNDVVHLSEPILSFLETKTSNARLAQVTVGETRYSLQELVASGKVDNN